MTKTSASSSLGGWIAYTDKDPEEVLISIWRIARLDYTGLKGFPNGDQRELFFSGITIRIVDDYLQNTVHELRLEITDPEKIQPEFFDMWQDLVKMSLVFQGPKPGDKKLFIDTRSEDEKVLEHFADMWNNRGKVRRKGYYVEDWLEAHGNPLGVTPKKLQRCAKKLRDKEKNIF